MVTGSTVNVSMEAAVISNIGHSSPGTIGFLEGVFSLDIITITLLRSLLHIPCVMVIHSVFIRVFGVGL